MTDPSAAAPSGEDPDRTRLATTPPRVPASAAPAAGGAASSNVLPAGTRLAEFEVAGVIGEGGFGIVYRAFDHALQRVVAIKEYMPSALAARQADASVIVKSEQHRETFEIGLRSFINEARLLAQFDHPALVKVFRFWAAHGTAYMAMPLYEGGTLKQALKAMPQPPDEPWLRALLAPLLDAVELLHRAHCLHRDISPDNILLVDGRPLLLDFGAARRVIGEQTQALTVILKPGFAPIEQYDEIPGMKQGPWTDLYALAAVVHYAITGAAPPPAVGRLVRDGYRPLASAAQGRYSPAFLRAIDEALSARPEGRPRDVEAFRRRLAGAALPSEPGVIPVQGPAGTPSAAEPAPAAAAARAATAARAPTATRWGRAALAGMALGGVAVLAVIAWGVTTTRERERQADRSAQALARPATVEHSTAGVPTPRDGASAAAPNEPMVRPAPESTRDGPAPSGADPRPAAASAPPGPASAPVVAAAAPAPAPAAKAAALPTPTRRTAPADAAPRTDAPRPASPPHASARTETHAATSPAGAPSGLPEAQRAMFEEAQRCYADQRYQCTIERAEAILRAVPDHGPAQRLLAQAREGQERALGGDWKMR